MKISYRDILDIIQYRNELSGFLVFSIYSNTKMDNRNLLDLLNIKINNQDFSKYSNIK